MTTWEEAHARRSDPHTSHEAAELNNAKKTMLATLTRIYEDAWPDGLTSEEAGIRAGYTAADGAWKRVSDLIRMHVVIETGYTRTASSGRQQRVLIWKRD